MLPVKAMSPSPRRAWIEIKFENYLNAPAPSPSPRRAWIEISVRLTHIDSALVALPTEGVD